MKILVVTNMAPFIWGGAEELAVHLSRQLCARGHESEIVRIPFQWEPADRIPSQMLLARWLELENVDRVIALKFPAYLIRHPHKSLWLLHQYRQAYDLYDAGHSNIPRTPEGDALRQVIKNADRDAFAESRSIHVISPVIRERLLKYNGVDSVVLPQPVNDPENFTGGDPEGYVFIGGRINAVKRQHLMLEALAIADRRVKAVVAGPPDSEADEARLREVIERHQLDDRVHLDLGLLPRERYVDYVNRATAVAYAPFDEDSMAYVAMEASTAAKPLITTTDSGGVLELVRHQQTGWIAEPSPESLADALTEAGTDRRKAVEFGAAARELWNSFGIDWDHTVEALLQ